MRVRAQFGMVMNLDKCIGCHTCSITCNNTWTNRPGAEYMWWNNVETKPGIGYPKEWENQDGHKGGWVLKDGKLELRAGGRVNKLLNLFYNPNMTVIDDYYEPWTYDYEQLINRPEGEHQPVARPKSQLTGEYMDITWGPNWEDDLAGVYETGKRDPNVKGIEEKVKFEFEQTFMMYLPRICEHCLNPPCVSSCPSGAIYKRDEDGIVLVDHDACRSWRFCVTGCPYKKVYFNWKTHKAEKCTFCFPRIEAGLPTVCSETCVGRLRYIGIVFYDLDQVEAAASVQDEKELYHAHLRIFLNPYDPDVIEAAREAGYTDDWIEAAQRSPVYKLAVEQKIALPLHPEYRTLPMVWYVPPLSPIMGAFDGGLDDIHPHVIFPAIDQMRIPIEYLANLLAAGDTEVIRTVLKKMVAMRSYMRAVNLGKEPDRSILEKVGMDEHTVKEMYKLSAVAKYSDRYVIPSSHREKAGNAFYGQGTAGYAFMESCSGCSEYDAERFYSFDWGDEDGRASETI
ncbi:nitrate reductase subunit beta [Geobacillus thermoleovorans]|uniref:Nitrate reductase n=1 Tax=Geobacillus thermopakistaniensis (strain MAS1) TaxID=1408282 RepID=A0A7U9JC09_GEOTM|nr:MULTISPECIES: nitrate reductase subunit beta [Geobacillus]ESU72596.1 nitrate reductase [Geobacillus sp. MAS1]OQP20430.1 nitrate reductase subunit beta [Geobacillus zalihae]UPT58613.1 nitrate reductase subunit beta [Geobacillus thermoleovorans]